MFFRFCITTPSPGMWSGSTPALYRQATPLRSSASYNSTHKILCLFNKSGTVPVPVLTQKVSCVISILWKSRNFQFSVTFPSASGLNLPLVVWPVLWIRISVIAATHIGSQANADLFIRHKTYLPWYKSPFCNAGIVNFGRFNCSWIPGSAFPKQIRI